MKLSWRTQGFTLMELAIVLMIVGTLMSGVLVAVSNSTANARITNTRAQLREIEEALYGFAQSQGRLPCPASHVSDGFEEITGGVCDYMHGFVPSATLGLYGRVNADGLMLDAWTNPLRYSLVTTAGAMANPDFSSATSIQSYFAAGYPVLATNMLGVCEYNSTTNLCETTYTDTAPAIVMSLGPDGVTYTSEEEILNAGTSTLGTYAVHTTGERTFVSETYSEDLFDDQLIWLSPYVLFNRLVSAGKLP